MIRRCNDFGAGGVSVAIGELADGLDIDLNAVPKKYDGLDGTELAISESQERMAVVVRAKDADAFIAAAAKENIEAVVVATVTDKNRLCMTWNGNTIVDVSRDFLNTNGCSKHVDAEVGALPTPSISCAPEGDSDAVQQRDRAARKAFGGAERRRERQLEHEVRAAPDRRFCAGVLVEHGEVAALHEISAHHADDDGVSAETFARAADVKHMAAVKRIVFRDNAADRRKRVHQITIKCARKCAIK